MKIRLIMLGKTRREEARALLNDYVQRIQHYAEIEISELRDAGPAALRKLKIDPAATVVLLDAAEGFPAELRSSAKQKISLSTLTMPHEFARVLLAEQIYRAFAILAGHPYPK